MTNIESFNRKYQNHHIVFFDGICNLCESSVNFIIKHDSQQQFHFMAQSTQEAQEFLKASQLQKVDSIILLSKGKIHTHSDAALEIAKELDGYYKHLYLFRFFPKFFRDWIYKRIAKYRYKFFGKKDVCMMPSDALQSRFLS